MPPRRRKNFFRIKPRFEIRTQSQRRLFISRIRLAYGRFLLGSSYNHYREVRIALYSNVRAACIEFLPRNNINGFFVWQMTRRFVDLIEDTRRERRGLTPTEFMQVAENSLDQYMGDQVTYFDNDTDDED